MTRSSLVVILCYNAGRVFFLRKKVLFCLVVILVILGAGAPAVQAGWSGGDLDFSSEAGWLIPQPAAIGLVSNILQLKPSTFSQWSNVFSSSGEWNLNGVSLRSSSLVKAVGYWVDSSPSAGIICNYDGSTDSVDSPDEKNFQDVSMASDDKAWAVGFTGGTAGSGDGLIYVYDGTSWSADAIDPVSSTAYVNFWAVSAVNETSAWAVGRDWDNDSGVIWKYNGSAWEQEVYTGPDTFIEFTEISMLSSSQGWVCGYNETDDRGEILKYDGTNWAEDDFAASTSLIIFNSIKMVDASNGWAVGYHLSEGYGTIWRYNGTAWYEEANTSALSFSDIRFNDIDMVNQYSGWTAGYNASTSRGVIFRYNGVTWSQEAYAPDLGWFAGIDMVSSTDGWAVGKNTAAPAGVGVIVRYVSGALSGYAPYPVCAVSPTLSPGSDFNGWRNMVIGAVEPETGIDGDLEVLIQYKNSSLDWWRDAGSIIIDAAGDTTVPISSIPVLKNGSDRLQLVFLMNSNSPYSKRCYDVTKANVSWAVKERLYSEIAEIALTEASLEEAIRDKINEVRRSRLPWVIGLKQETVRLIKSKTARRIVNNPTPLGIKIIPAGGREIAVTPAAIRSTASYIELDFTLEGKITPASGGTSAGLKIIYDGRIVEEAEKEVIIASDIPEISSFTGAKLYQAGPGKYLAGKIAKEEGFDFSGQAKSSGWTDNSSLVVASGSASTQAVGLSDKTIITFFNAAGDGSFSGNLTSEQLKPYNQILMENFNLAGYGSSALNIILDVLGPAISDFKIDDNKALKGDVVSALPQIKTAISDENGIDTSTIQIKINDNLVSDGQAPGGNYDSYDEQTKVMAYKVKESLEEGTCTITIDVKDKASNPADTFSISGLRVYKQFSFFDVFNFPNPFGQAGTSFSYQLNKESAVVIKIYDVRGRPIKTLQALAGEEGGRVGFNKIAWDGLGEDGRFPGNGTYLYVVFGTAADGEKTATRGKLTMLW